MFSTTCIKNQLLTNDNDAMGSPVDANFGNTALPTDDIKIIVLHGETSSWL